MSETANLPVVPTERADDFDAAAMVQAFKANDVSVYSSLTGDDFKSRLAVVNAMTTAERLADHLDQPIRLANFVAQAIEVNDEQTGEVVKAVRVILMDAEGKSYAAVSGGIARALTNLVGVVGQPHTWPEPITVVAKEYRSRNSSTNRFLTLEVVLDAPAKK